MMNTRRLLRIVLGLAVLSTIGTIRKPVDAGVPVGLIASSATGQGEFGSIKGKVIWGGDKAPEPKVLVAKGTAAKDPTICAAGANLIDHDLVVDSKTKGVKFAIVYLTKPNGTNPVEVAALLKKAPGVVIDQKFCEFIPYVTAVHQDQAIDFKSSDVANHNIHLNPFTNLAVNQMISTGGTLNVKLVAEKRPIPLSCDIHTWMKGYVMVFDHPFFAVTGEDGTFEIKGVPAGDQKLVIWQSAVGFVNKGMIQGMPVKVDAGGETDLGEVKLDPAKVKS